MIITSRLMPRDISTTSQFWIWLHSDSRQQWPASDLFVRVAQVTIIVSRKTWSRKTFALGSGRVVTGATFMTKNLSETLSVLHTLTQDKYVHDVHPPSTTLPHAGHSKVAFSSHSQLIKATLCVQLIPLKKRCTCLSERGLCFSHQLQLLLIFLYLFAPSPLVLHRSVARTSPAWE